MPWLCHIAFIVISLFLCTNVIAIEYNYLKSLDADSVCKRLLEMDEFNPIPDDWAGYNEYQQAVEATLLKLSRNIEGVQVEIVELKRQLALPNKEREDKDPRWFLKRWFWPEENPITLKLDADIASSSRLRKVQLSTENVFKGIQENGLVEGDASVDFDFNYYEYVYEWLQTRIKYLADQINQIESGVLPKDEWDARSKERRLKNLSEEIVRLKKDIQLFNQSQNSEKASNDLVERYFQSASKKFITGGKNWTNENMGRELEDIYYHKLVGLSIQFEVSFESILRDFKEFADLGAQKPSGDKLDDGVIVLLINTTLQNKRYSVKKVFNIYHELRGYSESWSESTDPAVEIVKRPLPPFELVALTDLYIELYDDGHNKSPVKLLELYYVLKKEGEDVAEGEGLNDQALVLLTRVAVENEISKSFVGPLIERFKALDQEARSARENYYLNQLSVALILEAEKKFPGKDVVGGYFKFYDELVASNSAYKDNWDEHVMRYYVFSLNYNLTAQQMATAMQKISGQGFNTERNLTVLGLALNEDELHREIANGAWGAFDEALIDIGRIPWLEVSRIEAYLIDDDTQNRIKRQQEEEYRSSRRRARRKARRRARNRASSGGGFGSGSVGSVGVMIGTGGGVSVTPAINVGGGISISTSGKVGFNMGGGVSVGF